MIALLSLLAVTFLGDGKVQLSVVNGGHPLGEASVSQHLTADGSKVVELIMKLKSDKQTTYIRTRSEYSPEGEPRRKFQAMSVSGTSKRRQTNVTFDIGGAQAARDIGGGWKTTHVELPQDSNRKCLGEFWFLRDHPKVGTTYKFFEFDLELFRWDLQTITFAGTKSIKILGALVKANEVKTEHNGEKVIAYLDNQGLPLRIENGDLIMERMKAKD